MGRHCAQALAADGHHLTAIVRPGSRTELLQRLGARLRVAGLDDVAALTTALQDADVLVHIAAKVHTHGFWREFYHTTVTGTRNVLTAARQAGITHFVHISSVGIYGWPRPDGRPFAETDPPGRIYRWNYYSRSKLLAERLVRQSPLPWTILRPTWIYGAGDTATLGRLVHALRQRRLKIIGTGDNRLSLIHVEDVARAVAAVVRQPASRGEIFNVADDERCPTQREFLSAICRLARLPEPTGHIGYRAAHRLAFLSECIAHATGYRVCPPLTRLTVLLLGGHRRYDSAKIRQLLDWRPSLTVADALPSALAT